MNGEERPTSRIILVIFLVVLYVSQFTIGQNNAHKDAKKRMITSKSLYLKKNNCFITKFAGETMNGAKHDSGCTQNVCLGLIVI